jgi:hypothetical protein
LLNAPPWSAAIAQLVEHVIRNDGVTGSSPVCGTSLSAIQNILKHRGDRKCGLEQLRDLPHTGMGFIGKPLIISLKTGRSSRLRHM